MKNTGIKVWVLTGDKIETAKNIGYAAGLLDADMKLYEITKYNDEGSENGKFTNGIDEMLAEVE